MANKEEITFVLNSNLDKIAKHAQILSDNVDKLYQSFKRKNEALTEQNKLETVANEGIQKMATNYSTLTNNISKVVDVNRNFLSTIDSSNANLSRMNDSLNRLGQMFNNINSQMDGVNKGFQSIQSFKLPDGNDSSKLEKTFSIIKKVGDSVHDVIKKILDGIHAMGMQLAVEAVNLKPFALEFMSSFSFNPLKFFGFGAAMKESFELMKFFQQMRHDLAALSDASGDASKAVSLVYEVAGGSAIASGTAQGVIKTLADQGIIVNSQIKSLGILSGNLQAATGIAASTWAGFTGELAFNYGIPSEGLENITSALIGTEIRGAQLEKVMGTVNKVLQTTGFIAGKPSTQSVHNLTKSIGGASKTFQAMGISAEKAGGFIEGLLDPENFEKNAFLFGKLGISASEYAGYLNDANGQQKLLDKTMQNLPQLAGEIANIQNPFARIQFAKTIGLDMQIVQQMAGKTKSEIEQILADYEKENKDKEALEAKKQRMAAEAAKFDDMMLGLKLKVLAPVMQFLSSGYLNRFFETLPKIAQTIGSIFAAMTPIIDEVTNALLIAMPYVSKMVEDFILPAIKMFPDFLTSILNFLPFFELGNKTITPPGEGASKEEIAAYNQARGDNFFEMSSNLLSYISKIYLLLTGWKAITFIGGLFNKAIGFFAPKNKRLIDVSLGEYSDEMRKVMGTRMAPSGFQSMFGSVLLALGGIGLGSLLFKYIFGSKSTKEFENLANFTTKEGMSRIESESSSNILKERGERAFMAGGGLAVTGGKLLYNSTNTALETAAAGGAFKATLSKELTKNVAKKVLLPVGAVLSGLDWYDFFTSDKTGASKFFEGAGAALGTASFASGVFGLAATGTILGAPVGVVAGITSGITAALALAAKLTSDNLHENKKMKEKKENFEGLYSQETRDLVKESVQSKTQEFESYGAMFGGKDTRTLTGVSAMSANTFQEFQKLQEEAYAKSLIGTTNIVDKKGYEDFSKGVYGKDEEAYLKERLALTMLSNNIEEIEIKRNALVKKYTDDKMGIVEAEAKVNKLVGENLEQTKEKINERMRFAGQEITNIGDTFGGIVKAFKLGDFNKIGQILSEVFNQLKITFLEIYSSIPGLTTSSAIGIGRSLFGEKFAEGYDENLLGKFADEDKWKDYLKKQKYDSEVNLKDILEKVNKAETDDILRKQLDEQKKTNKIAQDHLDFAKNKKDVTAASDITRTVNVEGIAANFSLNG